MSWGAGREWTMEQHQSNLTDGVLSSMSSQKDINIYKQTKIMYIYTLLTLPSLTHLAPLKSLITLYINICKITFCPSTQYAYIYNSIFICKLCYKDKLGQTYIYICILSGRKKCDKYAIIFTCKLCYKDKLGQTDKVIRC